MRVYSLTELFCLTRVELFALHARMVSELAALPEASNERPIAFANLRMIRRVLGSGPTKGFSNPGVF